MLCELDLASDKIYEELVDFCIHQGFLLSETHPPLMPTSSNTSWQYRWHLIARRWFVGCCALCSSCAGHQLHAQFCPSSKQRRWSGLQRFAYFLNHCNTAMTSISYLKSLDSAEENKRLVRKLPSYILIKINILTNHKCSKFREISHIDAAI